MDFFTKVHSVSLFGCWTTWAVVVSVATLAVPGGGVCVLAPTMMIKETSLRRDPDLRGELAFLARGCDFVLPSRFKKRLKSFQQQQVSRCSEQDGLGVSVDLHANGKLMINILKSYTFLSCFSLLHTRSRHT